MTITEVKRKATPTKERGRRKTEVSFGRGSSKSSGYTCFTCLRSHFTHGMPTVTTTHTMRYIGLYVLEGRERESRETTFNHTKVVIS